MHLYSTSSVRDPGTLYHARNLISARSVTKDPSKNYYAASEFLDKFCDAYLAAGALDHFGMSSINDDLRINNYEGLPNDEEAKQTYVHNTVRNFIDKHVMNQMPQQESAELSTNMICGYCGKRYVRQCYLRRHEQKEHGHVDEAAKSTGPTIEQDHIYNYTRQVLSRFSTSEYFRAKRLFPFVLELSAETKWN